MEGRTAVVSKNNLATMMYIRIDSTNILGFLRIPLFEETVQRPFDTLDSVLLGFRGIFNRE